MHTHVFIRIRAIIYLTQFGHLLNENLLISNCEELLLTSHSYMYILVFQDAMARFDIV